MANKPTKAPPAPKKPALTSNLFQKKGNPLPPTSAPTSPTPEGGPAAPANSPTERKSARSNSRHGLLTSELVSRPFRISPDTDWSLSEHIHREKGKGRKVTYQEIFEVALQEYLVSHNIPMVKRPPVE